MAIYFLNYSAIHDHRTTDTRVFSRLKDAIEAAGRDLKGYIIRQDETGNTLKQFVNGFVPSATEQRIIESILRA